MSLSLHIAGENADELLSNLRTVAAALLGSGSVGAYAVSATAERPTPPNPSPSTSTATTGTGSAPTTDAAAGQDAPTGDSAEVDAAGWPWSPDLHASTKGTTKEGLWRMKVGVSRPDPKPGFPKSDAGNSAPSSAASTASTAPAAEEEDEFAAFATAATPQAAAQARSWTDADLSTLCNQAAVKDGNPVRVKELIAKYVPEGQVQHSRNIPVDARETFAQDVESTIGIQYAAG